MCRPLRHITVQDQPVVPADAPSLNRCVPTGTTVPIEAKRARRGAPGTVVSRTDKMRGMAITHRTVQTNGIDLHVAEAGTGPPVILCHGFPESWYSWRHQLPALADAGFHAIAPDQRGYGSSDCPTNVTDYDITHLSGDLLGLLDDLGEEKAVFVGHDWGALIVWD